MNRDGMESEHSILVQDSHMNIPGDEIDALALIPQSVPAESQNNSSLQKEQIRPWSTSMVVIPTRGCPDGSFLRW